MQVTPWEGRIRSRYVYSGGGLQARLDRTVAAAWWIVEAMVIAELRNSNKINALKRKSPTLADAAAAGAIGFGLMDRQLV